MGLSSETVGSKLYRPKTKIQTRIPISLAQGVRIKLLAQLYISFCLWPDHIGLNQPIKQMCNSIYTLLLLVTESYYQLSQIRTDRQCALPRANFWRYVNNALCMYSGNRNGTCTSYSDKWLFLVIACDSLCRRQRIVPLLPHNDHNYMSLHLKVKSSLIVSETPLAATSCIVVISGLSVVFHLLISPVFAE